jgi:hypothetical protein
MNERYGSPEYHKIAKHRSLSNDITAVPAVATVGHMPPHAMVCFPAAQAEGRAITSASVWWDAHLRYHRLLS